MMRILLLLCSIIPFGIHAEDGYRLWLRYDLVDDAPKLAAYRSQVSHVILLDNTSDAISFELQTGLQGLLQQETIFSKEIQGDGFLLIGQKNALSNYPEITSSIAYDRLGSAGYQIQSVVRAGKHGTLITANSNAGLLYGSFAFLKLLQTHQDIRTLEITEVPKIENRLLNHWDNLDRTVERGYAGFSIWDWHRLPDYIDRRYIDYARANASIGINGTVLTNVNSNALVLRSDYLNKVKALADVFRPYHIKVYLTARFSAPIQLGGMDTADPSDEAVQQWWKDKAQEIYALIPDFGGFLVKANSEGQPGPQEYHRTHADGANMLADAVAPYGGIVMWRAFVYEHQPNTDRANQAYEEFVPLDGLFRDNVIIQAKNGPIDFMPREPHHPLFGGLPKSNVMMEFQITKEYLGQGTHLVYLGPMYEEVLQTETYAYGAGSTVGAIISGKAKRQNITAIAGVANIGNDRNWTGHLFGQADWYTYGRMAWDPNLTSTAIADEWIRMTFSNNAEVINPIKSMMLKTHEACVNYISPLGLHHIMGPDHHYGPGPWITNDSRADWSSVYYHRADSVGIGFDRTEAGSNAVGHYHEPLSALYNSRSKIPEKYLLWFHKVRWTDRLSSGMMLWEAICRQYYSGAAFVTSMRHTWHNLKDHIDTDRHRQVTMLLRIQEKEAKWFRDACVLYFQTFSKMDIPSDLDPPKHDLGYYKSLTFPYAPGIKPKW